MQPFEKHLELADHIRRMAATGRTGNMHEWNSFLSELNKALENDQKTRNS